jgi:NitT/TauT family transport system ATP-binding protein
MTALSMRDITMTFPDGTRAIDGVDLSIERGEFVTVVGPSGCGKSTLLRIISGLQQPTSGSCNVDSKHLGYVFQDSVLLPWRNVRKNVELNAELQGVPKERRQESAQNAIDLVKLNDHVTKFPHQLSGGMKMRCSLARSLVSQPQVFLFDEPFGALDEMTREHLNDELLNIFLQEKFAGLFITHSIQEAVFLSTRVIVMSSQPGRFTSEHKIDFPFPRVPDIRYSAEFAQLCGRISHDLKLAHA